MEFPECVVCLEKISKHTSKLLLCGHTFHTDCINLVYTTSRDCPICKKPFTINSNELPRNYLYDDIIELNQVKILRVQENELIQRNERIIKNLQDDKKKIRNEFENKLKIKETQIIEYKNSINKLEQEKKDFLKYDRDKMHANNLEIEKNRRIIKDLEKEKINLFENIQICLKEKELDVKRFNKKLKCSEIENLNLKSEIKTLKTNIINMKKYSGLEIFLITTNIIIIITIVFEI